MLIFVGLIIIIINFILTLVSRVYICQKCVHTSFFYYIVILRPDESYIIYDKTLIIWDNLLNKELYVTTKHFEVITDRVEYVVVWWSAVRNLTRLCCVQKTRRMTSGKQRHLTHC